MPTASGLVSVNISRAGDVSIVGDSAGNFVAVQFSKAGLTVSGWGTGTLIRTSSQKTSDSVVIPLNNSSGIRSLSVSLGADTLLVHAHNAVAADQLSSPALFRQLSNTTTSALSQPVRAGRDLLVDLGAGDDATTLLAAEAGRDGNISMGAGQDVLTASNLRSARSLRFTDAEKAALQNITAVIQLAVRGTAAADTLDLERISATRIDVDLAAGNDRLSLGENLFVRTFATFEGGLGSNRASAGTPRFGFFFRRTTLDLTSSDTLELLAATLVASPQMSFEVMMA